MKRWDWFGIFMGVLAVMMVLFIAFSMYMTFKQNQRYDSFRTRCEAAGGVWLQARDMAPVCVKPDAFVKVPPK